jgi:assimilatory nitrate reductase catalytic subunit
MFAAIGRGEIKALWVMATNPAVSLPHARAVRDALKTLELFVVSDNVVANDTAVAAHVLLPAAAWGEKDGTVTNSERRISRQRAFLARPGEAMPDWWIVAEVARRMGFGAAFSYSSAADIFREHAALSAFENSGARDFDIGGLADLGDDRYAALQPVQWPVLAPVRVPSFRKPFGCPEPITPAERITKEAGVKGSGLRPKAGPGTTKRFFAAGGFFTPDRKACFIAPERPGPKAALSEAYPFRLNTGRVRDQWHTMTRSGLSPRLAGHAPEPFVAIHPADAQAVGLDDGGFAQVTTQHGACVLKVALDAGERRGSLFVPIHWSDATASSARVGELVAPHTDPFSGQPEAKATPAAIAPVTFRFRGFAVSRQPIELDGAWWARVALSGGAGLLFATNHAPTVWRERALFGPDAELAEYTDGPRHLYRVAAFRHGRLEGCLFIGPAGSALGWEAVKASLDAAIVSPGERRVLLSGRSAQGVTDTGPLVCTCFGMGLNAIRDAIATRSVANVEEIGRALKAGTNCGSCLPELKRIVGERTAAPA